MVKFFKRRKLFDEDADWVPQKGRAFKMKGTTQKEEPPREEPPKEEHKVPFRMKAEPPNIKYDLPKKEPKHEPERKQDKIKNRRRGDGQGIRTRRRLRRGQQYVCCGESHRKRLVR